MCAPASFLGYCQILWGSGKKSACNSGDMGSIPGSGRSPGGGNANPLQYSCQENPMDREAWWAIVHWVAMDVTAQMHVYM